MVRVQHGALSRRQLFVTGAALAAAATTTGLSLPVHAATGLDHPPAKLPPRWAQEWLQTCFDLTWRHGPSPTQAARCYAYVAIAMYEACVAGMPRHQSLGGQLTGLGRLPEAPNAPVDWPVALAAAAHMVAGQVYDEAAPELLAGLDAQYDAHLTERRAAGVKAAVIRRSVDHGRAVATRLGSWIAADGYAGIVGRPYTPPTGEDKWESTPPNYRPAIEPYWSEIRPMVMTSAAEVAPVPHLPFSSEEGSPFWRQAMATYETSLTLTDEQRAIARFWTDNPLTSGLPSGHWMLIVSQVATQQLLDLATTLEAMVRTGVALHDAFLSCWTWKYHYQLIRPVTYVRRYIDSGWITYVNTPQFPEYTSGHSVASRAASTVLTHLLGDVPIHDDSHADRNLPARHHASFTAAANEAAQSRIYGGIHYPMGIENGKDHGDLVGAVVLARLRTRR